MEMFTLRSNDEIIKYLTELKSEKQLSISEIARRVGMAKSTVSRYFNKTREFPMNDVDKFAKAFGISSADILGMDNSTPTPKTADLADEDVIFTYEGKRIPPEDLEYMKRILRGGKA